MKHIGVIIQGRLTTYGQGPNNTPEGFNAKDTILKNIENLTTAGFDYVVSIRTPEGEEEKTIFDDLLKTGVPVVCNDDPPVPDPDHRHKQRLGILSGIQELGKRADIDYFVKIRTDMLMPERFWSWVKETALKDEKVLYVSELTKAPFCMGDFVYAARRDIFGDFVESIVKHEGKILHPLVAFDDGVKYAEHKGYVSFKRKTFQELHLFYWFSVKRTVMRKIWNEFIATNLRVLPEDLWNDIVWRKRRMGSFLKSSDFKFDVSPLETNQNFMQAVRELSDGYVRYWGKSHRHPVVVALYKAFQEILRIKGAYIYRAKKLKGFVSRKLIQWNPFIEKHSIWCRSACLGHDIFKLKNPDARRMFLICQQKTRLDLFLDQASGLSVIPRVKSEEIKKFVPRDDIYGLLQQQEELPWLKTQKIDYMLMDSFAELTDQKFTHKKEGWAFFSHYSDIEHTPEFERDFESNGLLEIGKFGDVYEKFFAWFENAHPGKHVVFLHYPTTLDNRTIYKERAAEILRVLERIAEKRPYVYNVHIDDSMVFRHENDDFPYHYARATNDEFVKRWIELEQEKGHAKK